MQGTNYLYNICSQKNTMISKKYNFIQYTVSSVTPIYIYIYTPIYGSMLCNESVGRIFIYS